MNFSSRNLEGKVLVVRPVVVLSLLRDLLQALVMNLPPKNEHVVRRGIRTGKRGVRVAPSENNLMGAVLMVPLGIPHLTLRNLRVLNQEVGAVRCRVQTVK
jgi:hypothetical protein